MDNPRQEQIDNRDEKALRYEVFDPIFVLEKQGIGIDFNSTFFLQMHDFTRGNEYPIYEERNDLQQEIVMYRTINDNGEMVWKNSQYFYLKSEMWAKEKGLDWKEELLKLDSKRDNLASTKELIALAECDIRKKYREQERHIPLEKYMEILPTWRILAGMTANLSTNEQLKEMDKALKTFMESAQVMQAKIQELLNRKRA